jgi:hypothetical protein
MVRQVFEFLVRHRFEVMVRQVFEFLVRHKFEVLVRHRFKVLVRRVHSFWFDAFIGSSSTHDFSCRVRHMLFLGELDTCCFLASSTYAVSWRVRHMLFLGEFDTCCILASLTHVFACRTSLVVSPCHMCRVRDLFFHVKRDLVYLSYKDHTLHRDPMLCGLSIFSSIIALGYWFDFNGLRQTSNSNI